MKGHLSNPEPRTCLVCGEEFIPVRKIQKFCPPPKRCRQSNLAKQLAKESGHGLDPRACAKCGTIFKPRATDQVTCGTSCPGKPDFMLECTNPSCELPERDEWGRHLLARQFIIPGNSRGKGNQKYCSKKCRDQNSRWRLSQRFRRYGGMTPEEFQAKAKAQRGLCMICKKEPMPDGRSWRDGIWALEQDHDHLTDALRDLLCGHCNKGIGLFGDDPAILRAAAGYIERHRQRS